MSKEIAVVANQEITVVTNQHLACGNAEYGRDLTKYLSLRGFSVHQGGAWDVNYPTKVVLVNWHPDRVPFSAARAVALKAAGHKVIVVLQNSGEVVQSIHESAVPKVVELLREANAVVAHERIVDYADAVGSNLYVIPHGIKEFEPPAEILRAPCIGTAGFPFAWKRTDVVIDAAWRAKVAANIFAPKHDYFDPSKEVEKWREVLGDKLTCTTDFIDDQKVIGGLSVNWVNVFYFESKDISDNWGQSGSARLGVAARRPMVVSRHRKLLTLLEGHEDEFYIADDDEHAIYLVGEVINLIREGHPVKVPSKVYEEQKWSSCAEMYQKVIEVVNEA